ncbi:MAG: glycosyltransferase family 2 protein [Lachnospiraceae bacterium]|nr:glycosyltransferase family 2 protein [Lachnospiraceae bacterium]
MGAFLSICIPTYNRAEVVYKTVRNILNYNGNNIEIVVSNNCSSDNTEELLLEIKDKRVKYFKNNYNNGYENIISVLTYASGEYLLLCSDEDDVVLDKLPVIMEILQQESPAIMLCGVSAYGKPYVKHRNGVYEKGYHALREFGYGTSYISGYIYNKAIMKKVMGKIYGTNINKRFGYGFCFSNLAREMLGIGKLIMREEMIILHRIDCKSDAEAVFDDGKFCFSPEARVLHSKEALVSISKTPITHKEKYYFCRYFINKYILTAYIEDYKITFNKEKLKRNMITGNEKILEYYKNNRKNASGIKFYLRLHSLIVKYKKAIDEIGILKYKYKFMWLLYPKISVTFTFKYYKVLLDFVLNKNKYK